MRTAIYPGTFDPITLGHIDVIKKCLKIVDKVIVATTNNVSKKYFFSIEERISIINNLPLLVDKKMDVEFALGKLTISIDKKNSIHMKGPVSNIKNIEIEL